jgi:hypothetical protein
MTTTIVLCDPAAAAFSRIVTEGMNSQTVTAACEAGLTVGDVRRAGELSRAEE